MSDVIENQEDKPNHYYPFEITEKGFKLRQRAIAEGEKVVIEFTRGCIGKGRPEENEDMYYRTDLVEPVLDVIIKENYAKHVNHIMTIVIDNTELEEDLLMTEMGIFVRLLNRETKEVLIGETLYGYTFTNKYDYVPTAKTYFIYREVSFNTVLSREGKFEIIFDKNKIYVTRKELDEILKEFEKEVEIIVDSIADGTIQENLNADMVDGKHAAMIPQTTEKNDLVGMINEVRNRVINLETRVINLETRVRSLENNAGSGGGSTNPDPAPVPSGKRVFTQTSSTFTVPAGVTTIYVSGIGAGGTSNGDVGFTNNRGGGSGAVAIKIPLTVVPGTDLIVFVEQISNNSIWFDNTWLSPQTRICIGNIDTNLILIPRGGNGSRGMTTPVPGGAFPANSNFPPGTTFSGNSTNSHSGATVNSGHASSLSSISGINSGLFRNRNKDEDNTVIIYGGGAHTLDFQGWSSARGQGLIIIEW